MSDNTAINPIRERLYKIAALASSGIEGERINASRILRALCDQYGLSPEDLFAETRKNYDFKVLSLVDLTILRQCYFRFVGSPFVPRAGRRFLSLSLTRAEAIDLQDAYNHYRRAFARLKRQINKDLLPAFIVKHDLFDRAAKPAGNSTIAEEAVKRICSLARSLQSDDWRQPRARLESAS